MEKLRDYLLGSKFSINTLTYIKENKLRPAQIRWLSEFGLFDLDLNIEQVSQVKQWVL